MSLNEYFSTCRSGWRLGLLLGSAATCTLSAQQPQQPQPKTQQTVSVSTREQSPVGVSARTSYTLAEQQLQQYPAVTLDEALGQHAGFQLFRRAPSRVANPTSEGISLRGLGSTAASRTLVLEDGAPLNDPFGGYIHWDEQPELSVESVTLVTGGGSDLYGSSALAGVIDLAPLSPASNRLLLSGLGGSQTTADVQALASSRLRRISALGAGESLSTGGYIVTDPALAGAVDVPANVRSQSYRAELGRRDFSTQRFFATGDLLNETRSNGTPLQTNATRFWRYLGAYDLPVQEKFSARARVFGSQQGYRQSFSAIAANRNTEALSRLQRVHTQEFGASADGGFHRGGFALLAGADVRDLRGTDVETPISRGAPSGLQDTSARQRFSGGFVELLLSRGAWSGAASVRVDAASNLSVVQTVNSSALRPADRTEYVPSPRLGLTRTFGARASVHASGFRAFRTPTLNELYRTGQVGQETTLANAALTSERATGYEIGTDLSTRSGSAALQATYFWTEINRPVSAVLLSQTATTITNLRQNLGQIRSLGTEIDLRLWSAKPVSVQVGYQYAHATVTSFKPQPALVGNWIPQVPRQSLTAQLRARRERVGELTLAARAIGMSYDDAANQFGLARFFALDVSGSHALTERLDVNFLVQNLTDRRPQVSRTPVLTLGSPIFAEAGLRLRLGAR